MNKDIAMSIADERSKKEALEECRRRGRERGMIPFPDKKYQIIYADPPWSYNDSNCGGGAEKHYRGMPKTYGRFATHRIICQTKNRRVGCLGG